MNINELNSQFGKENAIRFFEGKGNLPFVEITNQSASAIISLYGAHVLHFTPVGEKDLLWNTEKSFFQNGKAIRGGIPLCFPWFGPHETDNTKAQHGFARLSTWKFETLDLISSESTQITLTLNQSAETLAIWPFFFSAKVIINIAKSLTVSLQVLNTGNTTFTYTDALHSYLNISNINNIKIDGLHYARYFDGFDRTKTIVDSEKHLVINKEENRRYVETTSDCVIYDEGFSRKLRVAKKGSQTTIVWNPWNETAKAMTDMDENDYKTMICIEAANYYSDFVTLEPGQSHSLTTILSLE